MISTKLRKPSTTKMNHHHSKKEPTTPNHKLPKNNSSSLHKKGMGVGQVFVFMIAAITFALIAIFGYRAIGSFLQNGEQVQFIDFKNDLEGSIKKIYTEYGSVREETYNPPASFSKICFVDLDSEFDEVSFQALCDENQIACDLWQTANENKADQSAYDVVDQNVFLTPQVSVPIKVHHISILEEDGSPAPFFCQNIDHGSFKLILEGKGDHTEISPPSASQ